MNQKIFFIILIIFLLTNEFYSIITNIIKYGFYFILFIGLIKIINPNIASKIKNNTINIINTDISLNSSNDNLNSSNDNLNNITQDIFSKVATHAKSYFSK
jgi:hypothetical protein